MEQRNTSFSHVLEMNRITVSLIDELRFLGFGFKELKQFRDTVAEVIRSNGLPLGDGSAVEQILEDIRTDYEPILGFKTKIRDQRKVLTNLTIEIQRQLGIYNALPHVNILLNSLIRKGFGEDEIVRVAADLLENHPRPTDSSLISNCAHGGANTSHRSFGTPSLSPSTSSISASNSRSQQRETHFNSIKDDIGNRNVASEIIDIEEEDTASTWSLQRDDRPLPSSSDPSPDSRQMNIKKAPPTDIVVSKHGLSLKCSRKLRVFAVDASGSEAGNLPHNILDRSRDTRWSNRDLSSWLLLDLGLRKSVESIQIAWFQGNKFEYYYRISVSDDGTKYTCVKAGTSRGNSSSLQSYALVPGSTARFIKISVNGNNKNDLAGIVSIEVLGTTCSDAESTIHHTSFS